MKKLIFVALVTIISTCLFAGDKPEFKVSGRIQMELVNENNMQDFKDFNKDDSTGTHNDKMGYGQGRVDLTFKAKLSDNVSGKIATRFEGTENGGDKWMNFGKDKVNGETDQLRDARLALQEAYVDISNLGGVPLNLNIGRKNVSYGRSNLFGDKVDGFTLGTKINNIWADFNYYIKDAKGQLEEAEGTSNKSFYALHAGMNDIAGMANAYAYFVRYGTGEEYDGDNSFDGSNYFGLAADAKLMNNMIMPYFEFATRSGDNGEKDDDKETYSGMMLDLGSDFEMKAGFGKVDAGIEYFMMSGNDEDTADEDEGFGGIIGDREEGYLAKNIATDGFDNGVTMFKLGAGVSPEMLKGVRFGFNYWMFNNNASNLEVGGKDLSTENLYNELGLDVSWKCASKTKIYGGISMITPNKDTFGEDSAMAMWFGTQFKL